MKRKKAILCALVGIGFITSAGTVKANAMTMKNDTTTKCIYKLNEDQVERLLYTLPYTINTTSLKGQFKDIVNIIVSEMAYSSLNEDQQRRVDPYAVATLRNDERSLKSLAKDEVKALEVVYRIIKLENEIGYSRDAKSINKETLNLDNKNIEEIKNEMRSIENVYEEIVDYAIRYSPEVQPFMNDLYKMETAVFF